VNHLSNDQDDIFPSYDPVLEAEQWEEAEAALHRYEQNKGFILDLNARFPEKNLLRTFEEFLGCQPYDRPKLAREKLKVMPRTGYVRRGVPVDRAETVLQHVEAMQSMATDMRMDHKVIKWDYGQPLMHIINAHDMGEAIVGDFTPKDIISSDEKFLLEDLAIEVIYACLPSGVKDWNRFEKSKGKLAGIARDIDKLQMVDRSLQYQAEYPHLNFQDLIDSVNGRKWTDDGIASYHKLICQRHGL
jgi:5'-deoxynucleotidase YfbR-like HD superfamily hydrolase